MTWKNLKDRLSDPIVAGGILLLVLGEVQAQSDVLLSWLGQTGAGRVLSLIGIFAMMIRYVQALPPAAKDDDANDQAGFVRPLMLAVLLAIAAPVFVTLPGCAQFGLAQPASFSDRLAYSYGTHTAVLAAATASLEAGEIGSEDATRVLKVADQARQALDAARLAAGAGDVATAEGRLQLATSLLTELQTYLRRPS